MHATGHVTVDDHLSVDDPVTVDMTDRVTASRVVRSCDGCSRARELLADILNLARTSLILGSGSEGGPAAGGE